MDAHTKEPWKIRSSPMDSRLYIYAEDRRGEIPIAQTSSNTSPVTMDMRRSGETEANARRIVACVNTCAGIPTDALERKGLPLYMHDTLTEQRDELLAIVIRYRNETPLGHQPHMIADLADAAIAKVKS